MESLHHAVQYHDTELVKRLLDAKADIEARDNRGRTPLMLAVSTDQIEMVKLLIDKGADIEAKDDDGCYPVLIYAIRSGHTEITELLLNKGANIEGRNEYGGTALMEAAGGGWIENLKLLLNKGANIESKDNCGWTPLMYAVSSYYVFEDDDDEEIVKLLIDKGADIEPTKNADFSELISDKMAAIIRQSEVTSFKEIPCDNEQDSLKEQISPKSLEIIKDKPQGWELLLFAELLKDYVENIRRDLLHGFSLGGKTVLKYPIEVVEWVSQHLLNLNSAVISYQKLFDEVCPIAFGQKGQPGDEKLIHYLAKSTADLYKTMIEWRFKFYTLNVDDEFGRLLELAFQMATNAIKEIDDYATRIHKEINRIVDYIDKYEKGTEFNFILRLTIRDSTEFFEEVEKLKRKYL